MATEKNETTNRQSIVDIKVTKNGPYIVTGKVPLFEQIIVVDKEGIPVEWGMGKNSLRKKNVGSAVVEKPKISLIATEPT